MFGLERLIGSLRDGGPVWIRVRDWIPELSRGCLARKEGMKFCMRAQLLDGYYV